MTQPSGQQERFESGPQLPPEERRILAARANELAAAYDAVLKSVPTTTLPTDVVRGYDDETVGDMYQQNNADTQPPVGVN